MNSHNQDSLNNIKKHCQSKLTFFPKT